MPPSGTNNFFGIKVSKAGIPVSQASDKQLVYKDDFSTKTYYDNTNARMIEGKLPDGSYGLWVSKPGSNVNDPNAANNNLLIFNSNQDILRVISSGSKPIVLPNVGNTVSSGSYTTAVSFSTLDNQIPAVIAYFSFDISNSLTVGGFPIITGNPQAMPYSASTSTTPILSTFFDVTTTQITFYFNQLTSATYLLTPRVTFTYFILGQTLVQ